MVKYEMCSEVQLCEGHVLLDCSASKLNKANGPKFFEASESGKADFGIVVISRAVDFKTKQSSNGFLLCQPSTFECGLHSPDRLEH